MKNILTITTILLSFFISCSQIDDILTDEGNVIDEEVKASPVTFKIKGLETSYGTFDTKSTSVSLSQQLEILEYWVYKAPFSSNVDDMIANEVLRKSIAIDKMDDPIGLDLPEGEYKIIFHGATKKPIRTMDDLTAAGINYSHYDSQIYTFEKIFTVTKNENINYEIELQRLVGRLEIVIDDLTSLPADIKSITPMFIGFDHGFGYWYTVYPAGYSLLDEGYSSYAHKDHYADYNIEWEDIYPTIPRSEFSKISKDNPIVMYVLPTKFNPIGIYFNVKTIRLFIQGSKDELYHDVVPRFTPSLVDQHPQIAFMRQVADRSFTINSNDIVRYTGKIGQLNSNSPNLNIDFEWNEIESGIDN